MENTKILGQAKESDIKVNPVVSTFMQDFKCGVGVKEGSKAVNKFKTKELLEEKANESKETELSDRLMDVL